MRRWSTAGTIWRTPSVERASSVPRWSIQALYPAGAGALLLGWWLAARRGRAGRADRPYS